MGETKIGLIKKRCEWIMDERRKGQEQTYVKPKLHTHTKDKHVHTHTHTHTSNQKNYSYLIHTYKKKKYCQMNGPRDQTEPLLRIICYSQIKKSIEAVYSTLTEASQLQEEGCRSSHAHHFTTGPH